MSKVNKSSKSDDSSSKSLSKSPNPKPPTKDAPKLEVIKVIAPQPPEPPQTEEPKIEQVSEDKGKSKTKTVATKASKAKVNVTEPIAKVNDPTVSNPAASDASSDPQDSQDIDDRDNKVCLQPIPEATEPFQYRAIGVVLGQYIPAEDNFAKGHILTADGSQVDAVLLGKIISIVKKRLQSDRPYLWVVYPRTNDKGGKLHVQISGVWAPVELGKSDTDLDPKVNDGYFSIRGEVSSQSTEENSVIVKIRRIEQKSGKTKDKVTKEYTKFKVRLNGLLPTDAVGQFWSINVQRQGEALTIIDGEFIGIVPQKGKRRPPSKGRFGNKFGGAKKYSDRPYKPSGDGASGFAPPRPKSPEDRPPVPKPLIKRKDIEPKSD